MIFFSPEKLKFNEFLREIEKRNRKNKNPSLTKISNFVGKSKLTTDEKKKKKSN